MSDRYLPDNEPRDILLSLEELAVKKMPHAPTFRKAADEITRLRADLAAIRPHIEAAERERCAKIAEGFLSNRDWVPGSLWGNIRNEIAAAIRRGE